MRNFAEITYKIHLHLNQKYTNKRLYIIKIDKSGTLLDH